MIVNIWKFLSVIKSGVLVAVIATTLTGCFVEKKVFLIGDSILTQSYQLIHQTVTWHVERPFVDASYLSGGKAVGKWPDFLEELCDESGPLDYLFVNLGTNDAFVSPLVTQEQFEMAMIDIMSKVEMCSLTTQVYWILPAKPKGGEDPSRVERRAMVRDTIIYVSSLYPNNLHVVNIKFDLGSDKTHLTTTDISTMANAIDAITWGLFHAPDFDLTARNYILRKLLQLPSDTPDQNIPAFDLTGWANSSFLTYPTTAN